VRSSAATWKFASSSGCTKLPKTRPKKKTFSTCNGYDDLSDRLDLLASPCHDSGDIDRAIAVLRESQQLCEEHGIKFDGEHILQECLDEKRNSQEDSEKPLGVAKKRTAS
jgi:hypothetical protein